VILPDFQIGRWITAGGVVPADQELINPASLDLRLGANIINLQTGANQPIPDIGYLLKPGMAILASTLEYIKIPTDCAAAVYLKSSLARKGLDHALAGWVDPGFEGELTLELHSHRPLILLPGQKIVQLVLMRMEFAPVRSYQVTGHYNGQRGPTQAR
jgi:dCTP deaminase